MVGEIIPRNWTHAAIPERLTRLGLPSSFVRSSAIACVLLLGSLSYLMAARSSHLPQREAAGLLGAYIAAMPMLVGLAWSWRRPGSQIGRLLVLLGFSGWLMSLEFSDLPPLFTVGVLAEPLFLGVIFYILLAYPVGRLQSGFDRWFMGAYAIGFVAFAAGRVMLLDSLRPQSVLSSCTSRCPDNPFNVANASDSLFVTATMGVDVALVFIGAMAVFSDLVWRLRTASRPRRRALKVIAPVAVVLLTAEVLYTTFGTSRQTDARVLAVFEFALIAGLILLPLAFLVTLAQAQILAGRTLRGLLAELSTSASLARWRDTVAHSLDDSSLRLDLWDSDSRRFRAATPMPPSDSAVLCSRQWVPVNRGRDAIAVLSFDGGLAEDPELLEAASTATALAIEYTHLEGELRSSLARISAAGDGERRRIARDLHDCAQQRLVALRIHLSLAGDRLNRPEERAIIQELGHEVDEALSELRDLTHRFYPVVLARFGIAAALRSASSRAALPIRIEDHGLHRHGDAIEHAVYFCCLEALQNAAKHGGKGASAVVRLDEHGNELSFEVDDDGVGFEPQAVGLGAGLVTLADRLRAVGGTLNVESAPGRGARISGRIAVL